MISPMAEAKTRKNTFFASIAIKQMNESAYQTPEPTPSFFTPFGKVSRKGLPG
jgi:hypothetical protein